MIKGHSDIPLRRETVGAIDDLAKSLEMDEWTITSVQAIQLGDGEKSGLQIDIQFLRPATHNKIGFVK